MSRPMNMLRTRRKDCNVKPNRRLDRKSSRGMLYENEELRLKTININAEVESRQSDIKKLKRENEMLKKGMWYLRDEYDKLERIIKDKKINFSSSSTCSTSNSDSCSSCSEDSEEVETAQNMRNVQKTNLRNMQDQFEQLSVVTEETSAENSEQSINRSSLQNDKWNKYEENVIQPDQSYPIYENIEKLGTSPDNLQFFSPIQHDSDYHNIQENVLYAPLFQTDNFPDRSVGDFEENPNCEHFLTQNAIESNTNNFYQNVTIVPQAATPQLQATKMEKSLTDLIVKIDNQNFNKGLVFSNTPSQSTFSNGGNLEELLNDIESISQKGLSNHVQHDGIYRMDENVKPSKDVDAIHEVNGFDPHSQDKPFKSELNVVLVPNPMPLITLDKYKHIQRSFENVNSKLIEELSVSQQDLRVVPPPPPIPNFRPLESLKAQSAPIVNISNTPSEVDKNPFFFGNLKDNYVSGNFFNAQYKPNNFLENGEDNKNIGKLDPKSGSKTNLLDLTSSDHISSENEENLKFKTSSTHAEEKKPGQSKEKKKSPNMSIRKKVSIHFKGKSKKPTNTSSESSAQKISNEKKHSLFDISFGEKDKNKISHQKTPSIESKKSTTETSNQENKTPTSSDSKNSNDKQNSSPNAKKDQTNEKKSRKSVSISPDRSKHVHMTDEVGVKKHKKHKKGERGRARRQSVLLEPRSLRERSFSVCTDRSNVLEHRLGLGLGFGSSFLFDDYSERERTNSLSSCDTTEHARKMSTLSNVPLSGKVPWCGCWGNGCL